MRSHKKFGAKKMIFRGVFGLFYQKYPKGGPLENFEKSQKKNFFEKKTIIPKILHNTHMRSHKKFCAKKMSFRGVFGLFYQKYPKGGPLENFEKKTKKFFFLNPP